MRSREKAAELIDNVLVVISLVLVVVAVILAVRHSWEWAFFTVALAIWVCQ
jgi:hypothetical protein